MQIINRTSESLQGLKKGKMTIRIYDHKVSFPKASVVMIGIDNKQFLHFLEDDGQWYIYINKDADGFSLCRHDSRGLSHSCHCAVAIELFKQQTKYFNMPVSFYIHSTGKEFHGSKLYQIQTSKPAK